MNQLKKCKRVFAGIICLIVAMSAMLSMTGVTVLAADKKLDVIFVIDDSASMSTTDPDGVSATAVQMFVDNMPSTISDVRYGITTYAYHAIEGAKELGSTKEEVKAFAQNNITKNNTGTDAAMGLEWAQKQFETNGDLSRTCAIILVGDGKNEHAAVRTVEESNAKRDDAVAYAYAKGIKVYTLAINPTEDEFRTYFADIASKTSGKAYELSTVNDIDGCLNDIFTELTGAVVNNVDKIDVDPGQPVTQKFDVPDGVFEMSFQCKHQQPLDIDILDSLGNKITDATDGVDYIEEDSYTTIKVKEPASGTWEVTYTSDIKQTIEPQFTFFGNMSVKLSKNQADVIEKEPVEYSLQISADGNLIVDDNTLSGYDATLIVTPIDKNGNPGTALTQKMSVVDGEIMVEYAIPSDGKYEIHAEIAGNKNNIKSNTLNIDVQAGAPSYTLWIILGIILLIVLIIVVINILRNGPGYIHGSVTMKVTASYNEDVKVFEPNKFNCDSVLGKQNSLSDLVTAYMRWYRNSYASEMAEEALTKYFGSSLTEVAQKIKICGNKKKQIIVTIPNINDMQVDGMDISKPKKMVFSSAEKIIDLRFKNGNTYKISLVFKKQ